jgi:hypothetical protein
MLEVGRGRKMGPDLLKHVFSQLSLFGSFFGCCLKLQPLRILNGDGQLQLPNCMEDILYAMVQDFDFLSMVALQPCQLLLQLRIF